ncbi:cytochrome P450, partial [Oryctes borbonicus]
TIVVGLIIILILQFIYKQHRIDKQLKGFVSPPGLPLLRHFFFFSSQLTFIPNLLATSKKYGERLKLDVFYGMSILFVTDKDLVSHILNTKQMLVKDAFYDLTKTCFGDGLVSCVPSKWKKTRKLLNPVFNVQVLERYVKSFETPVSILIKKLKTEIDAHGFDVLPYLNLCTLDIICETVMDITLNAQEGGNSQYVKDIHEATEIIIRRLFSPIKRFPLTYRLTKDYKTEQQIAERCWRLTQKVIDDRRKAKASSGTNVMAVDDNDKNKNVSLLSILLEAEIDGRPMTDEEIMTETSTFLFAGHDTSATAISMCLYCLSKHEDVQEDVVKELKAIFGNDSRSPTYKDLNEMRYLEMVVKESMRVYTSGVFISRLMDEDISFGDVFIPKGMTVSMFLYGIHMNSNYHPDPEKFDPSRFERDMMPNSFIPFGGGPRNCIGQRFAMLEIKYLVAQILRNYKIVEVIGHVPQRVAAVILRFKNGIMIKLRRR